MKKINDASCLWSAVGKFGESADGVAVRAWGRGKFRIQKRGEAQGSDARAGAAEELAAIRPELDGNEVIEHLGIDPGRVVGEAMKFLMEIRLEEGVIGDTEVRKRLDVWFAER